MSTSTPSRNGNLQPKLVHYSVLGQVRLADASTPLCTLLLLKQVATFIDLVLKAHNLVIGCLHAVAYNDKFVGRNWCVGKLVKVVLRRKDDAL